MSVNKKIPPCGENIIEKPCEALFSAQQPMDGCVPRFFHGELYAIGRIWIQSLRVVLVGATFCPVSSIHAAQVKKDPERPPPMRPSELPAYNSPHEAYKSFLEDKGRCDSHILHDMVLPYVRDIRKGCQDVVRSVKTEVCGTYNELTSELAETKKTMTVYWRADDHLSARRGLVATGGLIGYAIGSRGGIIRRISCSAFGCAATGMICFPKETDEIIRNVCYHSGKALASGFNYMADRNLEIRERLPCPKPKPPDEKFKIMCEDNKKK